MWGDVRASAGCEADSGGKNAPSDIGTAQPCVCIANTCSDSCLWVQSLLEATDADDSHLRRLANSDVFRGPLCGKCAPSVMF